MAGRNATRTIHVIPQDERIMQMRDEMALNAKNWGPNGLHRRAHEMTIEYLRSPYLDPQEKEELYTHNFNSEIRRLRRNMKRDKTI